MRNFIIHKVYNRKLEVLWKRSNDVENKVEEEKKREILAQITRQ